VRLALLKHDGCLHLTAKTLDCARSTVQEYCYRYPELQAEAVQARESVLDEAEFQLYKKVRDGDFSAICFMLKIQGKSRGYVERFEPVVVQHDLSRLTDEEMLVLGPVLMCAVPSAPGAAGV